MKLPVEDDFNDVLGKAQKGLELSTEQLAEQTGLSEKEIRDARRGDFDEKVVRKLARALRLNEEALVRIGRKDWYPAQPDTLDGFDRVCTPFYDMHVNAYVVWSAEKGRAIVFDTGTDEKAIGAFLQKRNLKLDAIYLTHAHGDHITGVDRLAEAYECPIYGGRNETNLPSGCRLLNDGDRFTALDGSLEVEVLETAGHTTGGISFVVRGLDQEVAVVGDALFAGSVGGANVSYDQTLHGLKRLLDLPAATILAPGHGPLTTVGQEREMNCFVSSD